MRHLGSILLSVVLAAGVYVLVGIGSVRLGVALAITGHDYTNEAIGAAALLAAGALYAAMVLPRLSPLGPLLAALAFLGVEVYALVAREQFAQQFDKSLLGAHGALAAPVLFGVPLLLAVPLLATMLSPQRWRGTAGQPAAAAPYGAAPYAAAPGAVPPGAFPPYPPPGAGSYSPPPSSGYPPPPLYPTYESPVSGSPTSGSPASGAPAHAAPDEESSATRPLYQPPAPPTYAPPPSSGGPSYPPAQSNYAPPARPYGFPAFGTGGPPAVPSTGVEPEPPADPDTTRRL